MFPFFAIIRDIFSTTLMPDSSMLKILAAVRLLFWIMLPSNSKKPPTCCLLEPEARAREVDSGSLMESS